MNSKRLLFAWLMLVVFILLESCATSNRFSPDSFAQGNKYKKKSNPTSSLASNLTESKNWEEEQQTVNQQPLELNGQATNETEIADTFVVNNQIITPSEDNLENADNSIDSPKGAKEIAITDNNDKSQSTDPPYKNRKATLGFWFSVSAYITTFLSILGIAAPILAILGLIFSIIGLREINRSEGSQNGRDLAIAGIIISSLYLLIIIAIVAFFILFFSFSMGI